MGVLKNIASMGGGVPPTPPPDDPTPTDWAGKRIIGEGDSILYYAAGNADGYLVIAATEKNAASVLNSGNGGASLESPVAADVVNGNYFHPGYEPADLYKVPYTGETNLYVKQPGDLYFFSYGANDLQRDPTSYTKSNFKATLLHVLDYAVANYGWDYSDFILCSPTYQNISTASLSRQQEFRDAVHEVALLRHTPFIDFLQAMIDMGNPSSLLGDGLHPNTAGHAFLADLIINADLTPL